MADDCTGLTFPQLQAALLLDSMGDVSEGDLKGEIDRMIAVGLIARCPDHPRHYIITKRGLRAMHEAAVA